MGLSGVFGGLRQATVLGLEDQSEGPGVMRDKDEGNNRLYWKERKDIISIVLASSGHMGCLVTSTRFLSLYVCLFFRIKICITGFND